MTNPSTNETGMATVLATWGLTFAIVGRTMGEVDKYKAKNSGAQMVKAMD